jgi:O-antigen ligase
MFKSKFWLIIFFIYQFFSTLLLAIGVWPKEVVYLNLLLQILAVFVFDIEYAVYSVVLSIPFYLVIPNSRLDTFSAWRIVFAFLFLVFLYKEKDFFRRGTLSKLTFFKWDKYLKYLFYVVLLSVAVSDLKVPGLKKIAFVINICLLYLVIIHVIQSKERILRLVKVSLVATGGIVLFGFVQLYISLESSIYYFWQYWATFPARVYYGRQFADTALYSNSWLTSGKGGTTLRMFSILPDSHAFAVIAMFSIPFVTMLLFFYHKKWQVVLIWVYVVFAALAISFSGTRGVWAGALAPIILLGYLYFKHYGRELLKPIIYPIAIFILILVLSPLAQKVSVHFFKNQGSFLQRAESVYDLNESSNQGRIQIWKDTLKLTVKNPFLGVGYGNFQLEVSDKESKSLNLPKRYITAHSQYFDILAETGLIGLIFFLLYLRGLARIFWSFFKSHYLYAEDGYVFFVLATGIYMLWLFTYSLVDGTLMNDRVLMFFFINLAISASIIKNYQQD